MFVMVVMFEKQYLVEFVNFLDIPLSDCRQLKNVSNIGSRNFTGFPVASHK